jgi:hypothetical protein
LAELLTVVPAQRLCDPSAWGIFYSGCDGHHVGIVSRHNIFVKDDHLRGDAVVAVRCMAHLRMMTKRSRRNLGSMMTQLTLSSWETIYRRSLMMAQGTCSAAEYQRMVMEKAAAMQQSTMALMMGRGHEAVVAPYLVRSRANARRLRRK